MKFNFSVQKIMIMKYCSNFFGGCSKIILYLQLKKRLFVLITIIIHAINSEEKLLNRHIFTGIMMPCKIT